MASKEKTRRPAAIQNGNGGAGALAGCVVIVSAANVVLAAGVAAFALSIGACGWPVVGLAAAAALSAFMAFTLKGGAA